MNSVLIQNSIRFVLLLVIQIFIFNNMLYGKLKDIELGHKFHENNLTFEDVYELARNEIEKINPNYLKEFDKLINSGRLELFKQEENINIKEVDYYENTLPFQLGFLYLPWKGL